ncbi:MAG: MFS transporter [Alphaproteobacteria bacterium]|nr:MFS transporter [Alphaproteobacteria bacterium]
MSEAGPSPRAAPGYGRWLILLGVWLIYFCFGVTIASMAPLVGPISAELGIGHASMGAILGAWPLAYIAAAIPCGILLDRLGARRMLFAATLIMAASGVARSVAGSPAELLLAVALFGIGGPMISVGAPKVIARLFEGPDRGMAMGIYVTGPYLGSILSLALTNSVAMPLAGGDWRGVMLIYASLVATSGLVWLVLSKAPAGTARAQGKDGGKKFNIKAFADIVRLREVQLILAMSIGIFYINHALNNWLPELLRSHGYSAVDAGYWSAIPSAVGVIGALVIPRLAIPQRRLAVMAALFACSFTASLLLQAASGPVLLTGLFLQGLARGAMMTIAILLLMETPRVPPERLGLAGGLFFTAAEIGGVIGPLSFGVLSQLSGGFAVPLASITAVCLALFALLARLKAA